MNQTEFLHWVADLFEEPADNISLETERPDVQAWDSLGILTLMAGIDEKFDLQLTDDDIQGMEKIGDIFDVLQRNGKIT